MKAISIKNLSKTYKNGVEALKGIDIEVDRGDFFGLIGPNGAGKTTIIGILTDIVIKTSGKVCILGRDIDTHFLEVKRHVGIVPQEANFNIFDKVINIVVNQAGYYGTPRKIALERAEHYLKLLGLWEKRNEFSRSLSGGMKRRLMIVRSLVHEPELLILDEPTAGVDVELRRSMWDFLTDLNKSGKTIILTTHYLEEAENLCNNIAIIDRGEIIENTSKKELLGKLDRETFVFYLKHPVEIEAPEGCMINHIDDTTIEIEKSKAKSINEIFEYFNEKGVEISSMRNKANRLEELFLRLVEKGKNEH